MAIIDFVSWNPGNAPVYAYKFPHDNLSTYTQLVVAESQEALLFSKGEIIGKFGPGKHTLTTENLPILRKLFGIPFGGKNPFMAQVWFVNKLLPLNIDWSTDSMLYHDPDYQTMVPMTAKGRYGLKIENAERFLVKLVGTAGQFTSAQLTDHFKGEMISKTKSTVLQFMQASRIGIKSIGAYLDPLSENLKKQMISFWEDYGISLAAFFVTTVEVDTSTEVGRKIMEAMSQQSAQIIGGYTYQQSKAFEIADNAVDSLSKGQSGLIGAVLATNMFGGISGSGLMQPAQTQSNNAPVQQTNNPAQNLTAREVYCSNCAKKFANTMRFCPHCGDPYNPCPRCGADNDKTAKRCVSCGAAMAAEASVQTCVNCRTSFPSGSKFCPNCGKPTDVPTDNCKRCSTFLGTNKFCPNCGQKRD